MAVLQQRPHSFLPLLYTVKKLRKQIQVKVVRLSPAPLCLLLMLPVVELLLLLVPRGFFEKQGGHMNGPINTLKHDKKS